MHAVVGCGECSALWIVGGEPETTECPRCSTRHQFSSLKRFVETEDAATAREARAALLAERAGQSAAFEEVPTLEDLDGVGVDERAHMEAAGIDTDEVAEAEERALAGESDSQSRREIVREALVELETPSTADITDYAADRGIEPEAAAEILEKLVRSGDCYRAEGSYRLL